MGRLAEFWRSWRVEGSTLSPSFTKKFIAIHGKHLNPCTQNPKTSILLIKLESLPPSGEGEGEDTIFFFFLGILSSKKLSVLEVFPFFSFLTDFGSCLWIYYAHEEVFGNGHVWGVGLFLNFFYCLNNIIKNRSRIYLRAF
jgi:hypothetical protein